MRAMRPSISSSTVSIALTALLLAGSAGSALAQERTGGPGLGVELPLTDEIFNQPAGWVSFVYDTGPLHFDVMAQFLDVEDISTTLGIGGRLYYAMHRSTAADFSIGGGLFVVHTEDDATETDSNDIGIELGPKIRVFLAPSVALHTTFGLGLVLADDDAADVIGLVGRLSGSLGLTYFFR
jgi:hypothetical protein